MDSLTNKEFESIYKRVDHIVSLRGATNRKELRKRLMISKMRTDNSEQIKTLIDYGFIIRLLKHYYEGKHKKSYAPRLSRKIYRRMRKK